MDYIKLFRTIQDWEWWDDANTLALWVHLIVGANLEESEWHGETIPRGAIVTTVSKLASETGLSDRQIRTCLCRLENTGEIVKEGTNKWTKITICKYESYQAQDDTPHDEETQQTAGKDDKDEKKETLVVEKKEKKPSNDGKEKTDMANRLYALYPTKCPVSGRATGKSSKDKDKLARLLRDHTEQELSETIKRYIKESTEQQSYIKNFSTFLNNLPDYTATEQKQPSTVKESFDAAIEKAKNPTREETKAWWEKRIAPFYPKNDGETDEQYRERVRPSYESQRKSWIEDRIQRVKQRYL